MQEAIYMGGLGVDSIYAIVIGGQLQVKLKLRVDNRYFNIPKGFTTNYASIPKPIKVFWDAKETQAASLLHDYLYATGKVNRLEADKIFLRAMEITNVSWLVRIAFYRAVRLFGSSYYNHKGK